MTARIWSRSLLEMWPSHESHRCWVCGMLCYLRPLLGKHKNLSYITHCLYPHSRLSITVTHVSPSQLLFSFSFSFCILDSPSHLTSRLTSHCCPSTLTIHLESHASLNASLPQLSHLPVSCLAVPARLTCLPYLPRGLTHQYVKHSASLTPEMLQP